MRLVSHPMDESLFVHRAKRAQGAAQCLRALIGSSIRRRTKGGVCLAVVGRMQRMVVVKTSASRWSGAEQHSTGAISFSMIAARVSPHQANLHHRAGMHLRMKRGAVFLPPLFLSRGSSFQTLSNECRRYRRPHYCRHKHRREYGHANRYHGFDAQRRTELVWWIWATWHCLLFDYDFM